MVREHRNHINLIPLPLLTWLQQVAVAETTPFAPSVVHLDLSGVTSARDAEFNFHYSSRREEAGGENHLAV